MIYCIIPVSKNIKLIATDLSKQRKLDADPKTIQVNFTGILDQDDNTQMLFIIKEANATVSDFFKMKSSSIMVLFCFTIYNINIK